MSLPDFQREKALPFFPPVEVSLPDHDVSARPCAEQPSPDTMLRVALSFPAAMTRLLRCGTSSGLSRGGCQGKALWGSMVSTAGVINR